MTTEIATPEFDYGQLDREDWKFVQDATDEIRRLGRQTAENIVEIGRRITEVKERLPYGQYGAWLDAEFGWSAATADNFVNVYQLSTSTTVVELPALMQLLEQRPATAYEIARPSTPEPVRQEVLTEIAAGQKVTPQQVREKKASLRSPEEQRERAERRASADEVKERMHDNAVRENGRVVLMTAGVTVSAFSQTVGPCYDLAPWAFEKNLNGDELLGGHRRNLLARALADVERHGSLDAVAAYHAERKDRHAVAILKEKWEDTSERARQMFIDWAGAKGYIPQMLDTHGDAQEAPPASEAGAADNT